MESGPRKRIQQRLYDPWIKGLPVGQHLIKVVVSKEGVATAIDHVEVTPGMLATIGEPEDSAGEDGNTPEPEEVVYVAQDGRVVTGDEEVPGPTPKPGVIEEVELIDRTGN